ncbi:hypothetical protein [Synechococcus sp. GFB01]|uniref:hypothetical protein n=1 Tax=Synechococcus sp. GFB01 TaxID=1662190 RepID=UPI00128C45FB|nr:hypothetical protein [Synechococcus sp. GFB01]
MAIIAAFVLLLGVAALASRSQMGFVGQVFQAQNRQARDVAESAIAEFAERMNRPANRHLLIAGTTANWSNTAFRNVCTAVVGDTVTLDGTGQPASSAVEAAVNDFLPSNTFVDRGNGRSFRVESIQYLDQNRTAGGYVDGAGAFLAHPTFTGDTYGVVYRSGRERSLVRITIVGRFTTNGRTSTARVAREFEVVPKCCNRSFSPYLGGQNWGRDARRCPQAGLGSNLLVGLNGGRVNVTGGNPNATGFNPTLTNEFGAPLSYVSCWAGNVTAGPYPNAATDLTGSPFSGCTGSGYQSRSISALPATWDYKAPQYYNQT